MKNKEVEFNIGDKVVLARGFDWASGNPYETITSENKKYREKNYYISNYTHCFGEYQLELYKEEENKLTDYSVADLQEKLKEKRKEVSEIKQAIKDKRKMEEKDLKVALKTIAKRMSELGIDVLTALSEKVD